ncbi:hypothetical protein C8Q75DRAFT_290927 [Abortiporus biennis]|nr:hypothetical protein C8Q75DRAFT_290927 [Abortiporus biennis]
MSQAGGETIRLTLTSNEAALLRFSSVVAGIYIWEFLCSIPFDTEYFTKRRNYTWPITFYFLNRYFALVTVITLLISETIIFKNKTSPIVTFAAVAGSLSQGLSTINLSLRTITMWNRSSTVTTLLTFMVTIHWLILIIGIILIVTYAKSLTEDPQHDGTYIFLAFTAFTTLIDLVILLLATYKLFGDNSMTLRDASLPRLLFKDGLCYFILAFMSSITVMVFGLSNLDAVMSVIFSVPPTIICSIAATRAIRCSAYNSQGIRDIYSSKVSAPSSTSTTLPTSGPATECPLRSPYVNGAPLTLTKARQIPITPIFPEPSRFTGRPAVSVEFEQEQKTVLRRPTFVAKMACHFFLSENDI